MSSNQVRQVVKTAAVNWSIVRYNSESAVGVEQKLKSWKEIPGPSSYPVIGQIPHFLPRGMFYNVNGMELFDKLYTAYGPIVRLDSLLGRPPILFLMDAKSSEQILRLENSLPSRPGFQSLNYYRKKYKKGNHGPTGLLTEQGEEWKKFRSTVNPVLLQPKTIKLYDKTISEVADEMIYRMKSKRDKNNMIQADLASEMNLWALESIGVIALGGRLNCFDPNLPEDSPAKKLIQCVHDIFTLTNQLDFGLSFWRYYPTKTYKKAMEIYTLQDKIAKHFIQEGFKHILNKTEDEKGVLEKLMEKDEDVAYIMASDMLFAGVDTTANVIIATLYLLATNPDKQEKLRDEVRMNKDRKYLKACLKESMRILPVTSANLRQVTREHQALGYSIPKDMMVTFIHQYMSLMDKQYVKANEFIPERWIVNKDDPIYYGNADPLAYSPFGFGVRSCIGRRIAELELETFLIKIIENFRMEWFGSPLKIKSTSINYVEGPFNFKFYDV